MTINDISADIERHPLVINQLTKEQYEVLKKENQVLSSELYFLTDDDGITDRLSGYYTKNQTNQQISQNLQDYYNKSQLCSKTDIENGIYNKDQTYSSDQIDNILTGYSTKSDLEEFQYKIVVRTWENT